MKPWIPIIKIEWKFSIFVKHFKIKGRFLVKLFRVCKCYLKSVSFVACTLRRRKTGISLPRKTNISGSLKRETSKRKRFSYSMKFMIPRFELIKTSGLKYFFNYEIRFIVLWFMAQITPHSDVHPLPHFFNRSQFET